VDKTTNFHCPIGLFPYIIKSARRGNVLKENTAHILHKHFANYIYHLMVMNTPGT